MPAGGVGCSPLPCLRRLFTHDDDDRGGGDGVMMTMLMMDGPHCPWVMHLSVPLICLSTRVSFDQRISHRHSLFHSLSQTFPILPHVYACLFNRLYCDDSTSAYMVICFNYITKVSSPTYLI